MRRLKNRSAAIISWYFLLAGNNWNGPGSNSSNSSWGCLNTKLSTRTFFVSSSGCDSSRPSSRSKSRSAGRAVSDLSFGLRRIFAKRSGGNKESRIKSRWTVMPTVMVLLDGDGAIHRRVINEQPISSIFSSDRSSLHYHVLLLVHRLLFTLPNRKRDHGNSVKHCVWIGCVWIWNKIWGMKRKGRTEYDWQIQWIQKKWQLTSQCSISCCCKKERKCSYERGRAGG